MNDPGGGAGASAAEAVPGVEVTCDPETAMRRDPAIGEETAIGRDGELREEAALGRDVALGGDAARGAEGAVGAPGALLVIISGPSGVGKDTIIDALRARNPGAHRHYVVTCTTRARRPSERDGIDYHFMDAAAFAALRDRGALLEANEVHGNWYGTPRDQVIEALASGRDAVLKIDVKGAHVVHRRVPEALLIFVVPPSLEELNRRLVARSTETPEQLARRQHDAAIELASQGDYDHVVVNETDQVDTTAEEIEQIIAAEHALVPTRSICV
jgi:guanylate kinase